MHSEEDFCFEVNDTSDNIDNIDDISGFGATDESSQFSGFEV